MTGIIIAIIASDALFGFIQFLITRHDARRTDLQKSVEAMTVAVKANTHDCFHRFARFLASKDSITESELENLEELWKGYKAMGLNGTGEKLYKTCKEKPLRKDD